MEKINNPANLVKGNLYSDRDGVRVLICRDPRGPLYDFEETVYDEEKGDFIATGEESRLTRAEVLELYTF